MAIFTNTNSYGYDVDVLESGYSFESYGEIHAMMESCEDELAVIEAIHAYDIAEIQGLTELRENGIYEPDAHLSSVLEGKMSEIFNKIKTWIKNFWQKIKTFFRNLIDTLFGASMKTKNFIKKYESRIKNLNSFEEFEYDLYPNYKHTAKDISAAMTKVNDQIANVITEKDSITAKYIRGVLTGLSQAAGGRNDEMATQIKLDALDSMKDDIMDETIKSLNLDSHTNGENLQENVLEAFRGGSVRKPVKIVKPFVSTFFNFLTGSDELIKDLKKLQKDSDERFGNFLKSINDYENKLERIENETAKNHIVQMVKQLGSCITFGQSVCNKIIRAATIVTNEHTSDCKKVCIKALTSKPKK